MAVTRLLKLLLTPTIPSSIVRSGTLPAAAANVYAAAVVGRL
jgi:hypothetical protein